LCVFRHHLLFIQPIADGLLGHAQKPEQLVSVFALRIDLNLNSVGSSILALGAVARAENGPAGPLDAFVGMFRK
jgi:hypothetical protein